MYYKVYRFYIVYIGRPFRRFGIGGALRLSADANRDGLGGGCTAIHLLYKPL
jgi:hypothetical protein